MANVEIETLRRKAYQLRKDVAEMVYRARSGHPGGDLGMADVMTALHYRFLRDDPRNPKWPDRDRFGLSSGHTCPILNAILADKGYFPWEVLWKFRKLRDLLQGHPQRLGNPWSGVLQRLPGDGALIRLRSCPGREAG